MSTEKTAADVADKALDQVSGAIGAMAEAFKKIAPHAWEVMVRQQVVEGVTGALTCVVVMAVFGKLTLFFVRKLKENPNDDVPLGMGAVLAFCLAMAALVTLPGFALQVINPEYYAIKDLISVSR